MDKTQQTRMVYKSQANDLVSSSSNKLTSFSREKKLNSLRSSSSRETV